MRVYLTTAILFCAIAATASSGRSDSYPVLDVAPLCHGITEQSSLQEGFRSVSFDECMKAEQTDRESMIKEWSTFSASDKQHCIAEATMGGDSSYTDLITCLEMARDVRTLNTAQKTSESGEELAENTQNNTRTHHGGRRKKH